jgi:YNFM family putative membrane transporter
VLGSAGGMAWSRAGWLGVALFIGVLLVLALLIAVRLIAVQPLPENVSIRYGSGINNECTTRTPS